MNTMIYVQGLRKNKKKELLPQTGESNKVLVMMEKCIEVTWIKSMRISS